MSCVGHCKARVYRAGGAHLMPAMPSWDLALLVESVRVLYASALQEMMRQKRHHR